MTRARQPHFRPGDYVRLAGRLQPFVVVAARATHPGWSPIVVGVSDCGRYRILAEQHQAWIARDIDNTDEQQREAEARHDALTAIRAALAAARGGAR